VTNWPKASLDLVCDGRVARLTLRAPKANILDAVMIANLEDAVSGLEQRRDLHAIVIAADGPHFSFGASVEEHLPEKIAATLASLHGLLRRLIDLPAPTIAAIRGQCLGGGFELALACDLLIAEESAHFGCPEIKLGVFPPAASALLPARIGTARSNGLMLTGDSPRRLASSPDLFQTASSRPRWKDGSTPRSCHGRPRHFGSPPPPRAGTCVSRWRRRWRRPSACTSKA
jgi:cyclohexa-1,5-dienecarbonyl-CoA hydratase